MSLFGEPSERERRVWRVRDQICDLAVSVFGATVQWVRIDGTSTLDRPVLDDPLAGVRAAELVRRVAAGQVREYAIAARGSGRSWDEIAEALGLGDRDEPAVLAFEQASGGRDGFGRGRVWWRCAGCGQRVTDTGPFSSHPTDIETGHAEGCARHAADIAAWAERTGWDQ